MRKALIALAATLVAVASVHAAEFQSTVEAVDLEARAITFDNGEVLVAVESADISAIESGDVVNVVTDDATGEITQIKIAE